MIEGIPVEELYKLITSAVNQEYLQQVDVQWEILQSQAYKFLSGIKTLEEQQSQLDNNRLKSLIQSFEGEQFKVGPKIDVEYNMKQAYLQRSKYLLAFNFDGYLNKFFGKLPTEALFVYQGIDGLSTFKISMAELAKNAKAGGRINISLNALEAEGRAPLEENYKKNIELQEHLKRVQAAYLGVNNRLNRYYEKTENSSNQGGLLMWKLNKAWTVARVLNKGDIKEAYASALMSKYLENSEIKTSGPGLPGQIGQPPYQSHRLIASFFNNYIYNVTNMSAIRGEDIFRNNKGYSVKSRKSEMPKLNQYIQVAEYIAKSPNPLGTNEIQLYIEEKFPQDIHRNTVVNKVTKIEEQALKELIGSIENADIKFNFSV